MGAIVPFLKEEAVFGPSDIEAMSIAFDDLCKSLHISETANNAREIIAIRVIELARRGERSPTRLRERILMEANSGTGC